ncbi:unnamed protein product, partial [Chrysoparadoxa australica]
GRDQQEASSIKSPRTNGYPPYCDPSYVMPNQLKVRVQSSAGEQPHDLLIEVEKSATVKAFLGGYRNKVTRTEYHDASTQYGTKEAKQKDMSRFRTRDSQTCHFQSRTMQTTNECGTQMECVGLHLAGDADHSIEAKLYQSAHEHWEIRKRYIVVMQRYWRGYSARNKVVWALRQAAFEAHLAVQAREESVRVADDAKKDREMKRRMHPKTVEDFEILYNEMHQWRQAEAQRINESEMNASDRKAAHMTLLAKQTRLLQTIDRLKHKAVGASKSSRINRILSLMSKSKLWEMSGGEVAEISTPWTTRAQELHDLYRALEAPLLTIEERLDILLHVKWTVKEFDCRLTRDIVALIDREADLLNRGRGEASMTGLRSRILNLFLMFIETPEFNPEVTRFLRV